MSEFPSRVCKEEVGADQKAIQGDVECQYWHHCTCSGISNDEHDCLSSLESKWECSKCSSTDDQLYIKKKQQLLQEVALPIEISLDHSLAIKANLSFSWNKHHTLR